MYTLAVAAAPSEEAIATFGLAVVMLILAVTAVGLILHALVVLAASAIAGISTTFPRCFAVAALDMVSFWGVSGCLHVAGARLPGYGAGVLLPLFVLSVWIKALHQTTYAKALLAAALSAVLTVVAVVGLVVVALLAGVTGALVAP